MKLKKILPFLLALVMLFALVPTVAMAGSGDSNVVIGGPTAAVKKDATITVTVSNKAVEEVASFICGITFKTDQLKCLSITQGPGYAAMAANGTVEPVLSEVSEANESGKIGFGVACSANHEYSQAVLFTVTFKVLKDCTVDVTGYERSSKINEINVPENINNLNNIPMSPLMGDVTGDGNINIGDVTKLARYVKNAVKYPLDSKALLAADVTGDGSINIGDVTKLARFVKNASKYPLS